MSLQARVQDRPKGSGPYFPQPIKGKIAQSSAYSHVVATRIFAFLLLIFSSMEKKQTVKVEIKGLWLQKQFLYVALLFLFYI